MITYKVVQENSGQLSREDFHYNKPALPDIFDKIESFVDDGCDYIITVKRIYKLNEN